MSAIFVLSCYAALLWQFGWWAIPAMVAHAVILLAAAGRTGR